MPLSSSCCMASAFRVSSGMRRSERWQRRAIPRSRRTNGVTLLVPRPDPADHASYRVDRLIGDAFDVVAAVGHGDPRFHLVGHDWGASLAWQIADQHSERLASLTILSRPHPLAIARALELPDGEQRRRSGHHTTFLDAGAGPNILADNANWLRTRLTKNGVPPAAIEAHLSVIGNRSAMEAALAWYRARGVRHTPVGPTRVPTLFIWGDQDDTVGRAAAEEPPSSSRLHTTSPIFRASATMLPTNYRNR